MKTIYKYQIEPGKNVLTLPRDCQLLNTIVSDDKMYIYAIVETSCKETIQVTIYVYGTGWGEDAFKTFDMPEPDSRWSNMPGQLHYMTTVKQGWCVCGMCLSRFPRCPQNPTISKYFEIISEVPTKYLVGTCYISMRVARCHSIKKYEE